MNIFILSYLTVAHILYAIFSLSNSTIIEDDNTYSDWLVLNNNTLYSLCLFWPVIFIVIAFILIFIVIHYFNKFISYIDDIYWDIWYFYKLFINKK